MDIFFSLHLYKYKYWTNILQAATFVQDGKLTGICYAAPVVFVWLLLLLALSVVAIASRSVGFPFAAHLFPIGDDRLTGRRRRHA